MKTFTLISLLGSFLTLARAQNQTFGPFSAFMDTLYDNSSAPINDVYCASALGVEYPTLGSLPTFPNVGGFIFLDNDAPYCGSCWEVTDQTTGASVFFTAIDKSSDGFALGEQTMITLGGQAGFIEGTIQVVATQVDESNCGVNV